MAKLRITSTRGHLLLLAGAIIGPMLAFCALVLVQFAAAQRERIAQDARETTRELAAAIDRDVLALESTLAAVARAPVLVQGSVEAIHDYLVAVARPLGANITLRDKDSRQLVNTSIAPGEALPGRTGLRSEDEEAARTLRPVASGVFTAITSGMPVFAVVAPVQRSGEVVALLSLSLPVRHVDEVIAAIRVPENAAVAVVDRTNTVIARSERSLAVPGTLARGLVVGAEGPEGRREGLNPRGEPIVMFYSRAPRSGWTVALAVPATALSAPLLWSLAALGGAGLVLAGLALALALAIGRRFTWPIHRLAEAASRLGSGESVAPVATPVAEIRQVGDALAAAAIVLREQARRRDEAEAALRDLNATLESQVASRTAELTRANAQLTVEMGRREQSESQVRQLQKIEAVGQLTGGIAHDFNNMLAVIIGSLRLLRRRLERGEGGLERFVDGAMDGAERAAALTHRLLAFSRQQPLVPAALDANRLTTAMSALLRRTIPESIRIETVLAGGLWRVHADAVQLENAILNLALNARDAMPEGGRLTIETANAHLDEAYAATRAEVTAGQYVMIAITDSGAGMTPEILQRAFDPFFTTKPPGQGTGLGLSQVYGFIKQSGGHIAIYSEPAQGTTVKLYLPRVYGDAAEHEKVAGPVAARAATASAILVVEDDDSVRDITVEMLRDLGYRVVAAANGAAALRTLDAERDIALLLTDVVMPDMNGRKLAEAALVRRPELKVLYTTGYTRNAIVHNGVLDPGVHLLAKPFTVEALAAKLGELLAPGPAPAPAVPVAREDEAVR